MVRCLRECRPPATWPLQARASCSKSGPGPATVASAPGGPPVTPGVRPGRLWAGGRSPFGKSCHDAVREVDRNCPFQSRAELRLGEARCCDHPRSARERYRDGPRALEGEERATLVSLAVNLPLECVDDQDTPVRNFDPSIRDCGTCSRGCRLCTEDLCTFRCGGCGGAWFSCGTGDGHRRLFRPCAFASTPGERKPGHGREYRKQWRPSGAQRAGTAQPGTHSLPSVARAGNLAPHRPILAASDR